MKQKDASYEEVIKRARNLIEENYPFKPEDEMRVFDYNHGIQDLVEVLFNVSIDDRDTRDRIRRDLGL